jgi:hypothetical protein
MRRRLLCMLFVLSAAAWAAPRGHSIFFGKWVTVKWFAGAAQDSAVEIKVRPLYVDGRPREYTLGEPHEVTDRVFVVQQAYRLNDSLPTERAPQWKWQRGGWLLVERATGRVRRLSLPDFDSAASQASWYRDYAAYCGLSEKDGKLYAVVAQLGRRAPLLRQELGTVPAGEMGCPAPEWQRNPPRVTFTFAGGERRALDPAPPTETDDESKAEEDP